MVECIRLHIWWSVLGHRCTNALTYLAVMHVIVPSRNEIFFVKKSGEKEKKTCTNTLTYLTVMHVIVPSRNDKHKGEVSFAL